MLLSGLLITLMSLAPSPLGAADPARSSEGAAMGDQPTSLNKGIQPLIDAFNNRRDQTRFVAILSPTCAACLHGAEAIQRTVLENGSQRAATVLIVWTPMLAPDNEDAALESSRLLRGPHLHQFYDPGRRVGRLFRKGVFPRAREEMLNSLPPDHYMQDPLLRRSDDLPEWDIYMFFTPGQVWSGTVPEPAHWLRQAARIPDARGGLQSVMWRDSYSRPPLEGSLEEQLRELANLMVDNEE